MSKSIAKKTVTKANLESPTSQISVNNRVQPNGKTKNKSRSAQQLQRQPSVSPVSGSSYSKRPVTRS